MSLVTATNSDTPLLDALVMPPPRPPLAPPIPRPSAAVPLHHDTVPLTTRRITRLDDPWLPFVLAIWKRSFPERDRAPLSCWVGRLRDDPSGQTASRNLLAAHPAGDTRPVGMAYYEVRRGGEGEAPVGYLVYLATDPGYRGQGMGARLYREAINRMFAAGCRAVVFEAEMPGEIGGISPEDPEMARRRLLWYRRNGARRLGGAIAVAGIGGPQPLPEAVLIHFRPDETIKPCPESALACARIGLSEGAVVRTDEPLTLS